MKILICFGTRPEAIKMAPVIHELITQGLEFKVCSTAQHREMLDQVLEFFEIKPDFDLGLMKPNQTLNQLSASIILSFDKLLESYHPDLVLVHGDTTTSTMVSIAAFHRNIRVAHVEAGLRTFNKNSPFPEEINRQITARIAEINFAPTLKAKINLLAEGIPERTIDVTGNTIVDSLHWATSKMLKQKSIDIKLKKITNTEKPFILVTGHRRESFGNGLINICDSLLELVNKNKIEVIYPVHLNPKVQKPVYELLNENTSIHLIEPVSYPEMLWLMKNCLFIISDSGGIQEEAPTFGKIVLVTRDHSERVEGIEAGFSILVGTQQDRIIKEATKLVNSSNNQLKKPNPYGDGKASERIVAYLNRGNI